MKCLSASITSYAPIDNPLTVSIITDNHVIDSIPTDNFVIESVTTENPVTAFVSTDYPIYTSVLTDFPVSGSNVMSIENRGLPKGKTNEKKIGTGISIADANNERTDINHKNKIELDGRNLSFEFLHGNIDEAF